MILYIIWSVALLLSLHLYLNNIFSRFSKYDVKYIKPMFVLGNNAPMIFRKKHLIECIDDLYSMYPDEKFLGRFNFLAPVTIIKDVELIKKIAVQNFEHFIDHRTFLDESTDPFFGRNLLSLKGAEWKDMRSTLSPAFTSSKIRAMVPFINEIGEDVIRSIKKSIVESEFEYMDIDVKDMSTRLASDVIASCTFGLKVNSHTVPDNHFYIMVKEVATFTYRSLLIIFMYLSFPNVIKRLGVSLFSQSTKEFFKNLVLDTMKDRELKNIIRPDMIHLLMEARKGKLIHDKNVFNDEDAGFATVEESTIGRKEINRAWSDTDLIAQAILFFIAGFETVSTTLSFMFHEIAINPEVQEKLIQEIRKTNDISEGKVTYATIQKMTYLDMVVSEVLRLWSPVGLLDRMCVKDYNLGRPNETATKDFIIRKGEGLGIAARQIHRDPKYFPDPLKFDPERFSEENKHNIKPFTYMPFGLGPRNCIGSRFALCEVKVLAYQILKTFHLSPAAKTMIPVKLNPVSIHLRIKDGHWVRFSLRK